MYEIKSLRQQYQLVDELLPEKLVLVAQIMEEEGIEMWIVFAKEYNEDPVLEFITPTSFPTARRLTCLVFTNTSEGFKCYNAGRPNPELAPYYQEVFFDIDDNQMANLYQLITKIDPKNIALNYSKSFAFGDGLTKSLYDEFVQDLPNEYIKRIISGEKLCVHFLETRIAKEMEIYPMISTLATDIIAKGFSKDVIEVGVTTNRDLEWWFKQEVNSLGLDFWFPPTVDIQRKDSGVLNDEEVILAGDLLHLDFGIVYLGLCTDHQRLAYVAKDGEDEIPACLLAAFTINNRFQDIVCENYKVGLTGNEVFANSLAVAKVEGIKAMLYTHPIGHYGHGPGPTIGLYNQQEFLKGRGEYPVYANTCYALELNIKTMVPEYSNQELAMFSEETVAFDGEKVIYLSAGRDKIYLIK